MEKGKRFLGLSKFAPELPEFCNSFSLTDQSFRDGLRRYLMEHQCRFVFLDNLTALMAIASIRVNLHKMFLRGLKSSRRAVYVLSLSTTNQSLSLYLPIQIRREEAKYLLFERGQSSRGSAAMRFWKVILGLQLYGRRRNKMAWRWGYVATQANRLLCWKRRPFGCICLWVLPTGNFWPLQALKATKSRSLILSDRS